MSNLSLPLPEALLLMSFKQRTPQPLSMSSPRTSTSVSSPALHLSVAVIPRIFDHLFLAIGFSHGTMFLAPIRMENVQTLILLLSTRPLKLNPFRLQCEITTCDIKTTTKKRPKKTPASRYPSIRSISCHCCAVHHVHIVRFGNNENI